MYEFISMCEEHGMAITKGGSDDGAYEAIRVSSSTEPCVLALKEVSSSTIKNTITALQEEGRIDTYKLSQTGPKKWLGTKIGVMSQGIYEARTARENH
tara:strand:- start:168 stop:461 length:294 start_codon:yes stop_codon:yes gene_type:complete